MNFPKISVVIPTRNRAELLLRAVNSALKQSYTNIEVLVIIDGPDEQSVQLLCDIHDDRIRFCQLPVAGGGNAARNHGISMSEGEWIGFLDDDDEWLPDKLSRQVEALVLEHFDFEVVVACRFYARGSQGAAIWPDRLPEENEFIGDYLFANNSFFDGETAIRTSTLLVSKRLAECIGFSSAVRKYQEVDFLFRASRQLRIKIRYLTEALAIWNVDGQRASINNERNWRTSLNWIRSHRAELSRPAYSGFLLIKLASESGGQRDWSAFLPVLYEAIKQGRPTIVQLIRYGLMWSLPPNIRSQIRFALHENRTAI